MQVIARMHRAGIAAGPDAAETRRRTQTGNGSRAEKRQWPRESLNGALQSHNSRCDCIAAPGAFSPLLKCAPRAAPKASRCFVFRAFTAYRGAGRRAPLFRDAEWRVSIG